MPLNHYVTLGRSGLRVSPFCLGTMTFGEEWGWGSSEHESGEVLARYFDLGGNFVDTANFYTKGHSEKILGDLVGSRPHLRQRVVLATKFFPNLHPGDPNGGGCNAKAILEQGESPADWPSQPAEADQARPIASASRSALATIGGVTGKGSLWIDSPASG